MNNDTTTKTNNTASNVRPAVHPGAAVLWASAFIIMALIVTTASRLGGPVSQANADVITLDDLTVLSTPGGNGEDVVVILDRRDELVFVYAVDNARDVRLLQSYSLPQVFSQMASGVDGSR